MTGPGEVRRCTARIFPSWANSWMRCNSTLRPDGRCWRYRHAQDGEEPEPDDFTGEELIRTAREMDAAGVPPDAGEDAVRAVALVLRHLSVREES
jgi:hypothetical protein